ncbi:unnamed protein product [Periconia digitata]|uniref:Thymocyte nuclear protein 1 n=1 Tax=Periconia digitata TaxID=1303443 RepID=A0A9W4UFH5_9PLEO|nr:unnamed protein product [Periconia digitata]
MAPKRRATRQSVVEDELKHTNGETQPKPKRTKRNGTQDTRTEQANGDQDDDENTDLKANTHVKAPLKKPSRTSKRAGKSTQPPESTIASPDSKKSPSSASSSTPPAITTTAASSTNRDANGSQQTFWLLKAEPLPRYENGKNVSFSIDDLAACTTPEPWSGVRNFQARNNMLSMRRGDLGFFYHSNAKPSGIVGVLRVVEEAKVDETAFDPEDPYFDKKSDREAPKWWCVGVEFVKKFDEVVSLARIKEEAGKGGKLETLQLIKNARLSVCKVEREEWQFLTEIAEKEKKAE